MPIERTPSIADPTHCLRDPMGVGGADRATVADIARGTRDDLSFGRKAGQRIASVDPCARRLSSVIERPGREQVPQLESDGRNNITRTAARKALHKYCAVVELADTEAGATVLVRGTSSYPTHVSGLAHTL
jgi:hypothetical protein